MNFRLIENEQLAMKFPYEVPFWERCYPEWNKGFVNIRMFVGIRNFMRELHCNRLIFRESELYDNLKPNLIQSLYANFQVSNIIIIKVHARFFNRFYALKLCSTACFEYQRLTRAGAKTLQKKCFACLVGMQKSSTFAPAIERDAAVIEILKVKSGSSNLLKKSF